MNFNNNSNLSAELDLLFENGKLDLLKYLGILYKVKDRKNASKLTFEQLLYYYSILFLENKDDDIPMIYEYLRDKKEINSIIIYLENLGFVKIYGSISIRLDKLKVVITKEGIKFIDSEQSKNIKKYLEQISITMDKYAYEENYSRFNNLLHGGAFL